MGLIAINSARNVSLECHTIKLVAIRLILTADVTALISINNQKICVRISSRLPMSTKEHKSKPSHSERI